MKHILSIQSHVAYGYVGNRAAVFPLQRMGFEVSIVNTVQFSNHTGYGNWRGQIFSPADIESLIDGLEERGVLSNIDAVLSGYMGDTELGNLVLQTVEEIKLRNTDALYCCDPVMGDTGRGFFVKEELPGFFKDRAIQAAHIITPNQFELSYLSDTTIISHDDVTAACEKLHNTGPDIILATSIHTEETKDHHIETIISHKNGEKYRITTPRIAFNTEPNGSGDMTAALFLGHMMNGEDLRSALENTVNAVYQTLDLTAKSKRRELSIIAAQDYFVSPDKQFSAERA